MCHSTVHFQQWLTSELRVDGSARNDAVFILNFDALPPGEKWECALSQFSMQGSGEAVTDADGVQAPIGVVILDGLNAPYNRQVSEHTNMPSGILSRMDFSTAGAGPNTCSVNPSSLAPAICCTRPQAGTYRISLVSPVSGSLLKTEEDDMNPWVACLQFTLIG